jgi:hypothetical protein
MCFSSARGNFVEKCFGFGIYSDDSGSGITRTQNFGNKLDENIVMACGLVTTATAWASGTAYSVGDQVLNDTNKVYLCRTAGTSAGSGGPTGTNTDITDNTAHWRYIRTTKAYAASTAYVIGDHVVNGGNLYFCVYAGTSSGSGPTGTTRVTQTCGTAKFRYVYNNTASPNAVGMKVSGGSGNSGRHSLCFNRIWDGNLIAAAQDASATDLEYANYRMGAAFTIGGSENQVIGNEMLTYGTSTAIVTSGTMTGLVARDNHKVNGGAVWNMTGNTTRAVDFTFFKTNTDIVQRSMRYDDVFAQWDIDGAGKMSWRAEGTGVSAPNVSFERSASGILKATGKLVATVGLGVGNSAAGSTPGTCVKKIEVFDASGSSLGFIPVYDAIT